MDRARLDEAVALIPRYTGEHRYFQTPEDVDRLERAIAMLDGSTEDPELGYAQHAQRALARELLAENEKNRGRADAARPLYAAALHDLVLAQSLRADDPWALYETGVVQTYLRQYADALISFSTGIKLADDKDATGTLRFQTRRWKADVLLKLQDYEGARAAFADFFAFVREHFPQDGIDHDECVAIANTYHIEGRWAEAAQVLRDGLARHPGDPALLAELGYTLGLIGATAEATACLQHSIETSAGSPGQLTYPLVWLLLITEPMSSALRDSLESLRYMLRTDSLESSWEKTLVRLVFDPMTAEDVGRCVALELARRSVDGVLADGVDSEAQFFSAVGWWLRFEDAAHVERARARECAAACFSAAAHTHSDSFHWESVYAMKYRDELAVGEPRLTPRGMAK